MVQARARALTVSYLETLPTLVPPIFEQAQHSTANHRKNVVALHKIHQAAASITEDRGKGVKPIGEKAFCAAFLGMVNRVLPVKKGVSVAERVVKFVAAYAKFLSDQGEYWILKAGIAEDQTSQIEQKTRKNSKRWLRGSSQSCSATYWRAQTPRTRMSAIG